MVTGDGAEVLVDQELELEQHARVVSLRRREGGGGRERGGGGGGEG